MSGPDQATPSRLTATFALGFRPFYLGGAAMAVLGTGVWALVMIGRLDIDGPLQGMLWHGHELIFGFGAAILTGFLLTAVRAWTGILTLNGGRLAMLFGIWLAARVLLLTGPTIPAMAVDLAFLPLVALAIGVPLWQSGNRRNIVMVIVLLVLAGLNAGYHATALGLADFPAIRMATGAAGLFGLLITIIAGRVVTMFYNNATTAKAARNLPGLAPVLAIAMVLIAIGDISGAVAYLPSDIAAALFALVAALHIIRIVAWRPDKVMAEPILWILWVAYSFLPLALIFRALEFGGADLPPNLALHALTAGAMGGMMMAMMTRSALGHAGYAIRASVLDTVAYLSVIAGALIRVFLPLVDQIDYDAIISLSAVLWCLGFICFFIRYWPILTRVRADNGLLR